VFRLAGESSESAEYVEPIPHGTAAAMEVLLEFDDGLHDDFEAAIARTNEHFFEEGEPVEVVEACDDARARLWKLRKAATPLLMSTGGDSNPYPFIEDATVPPEDLAAYVTEIHDVREAHDTTAANVARAGVGTHHVRPMLNLETGEGVETMHSVAEDVSDRVLSCHGPFPR
jgi:FAD/FMN-containing dehydrogenase